MVSRGDRGRWEGWSDVRGRERGDDEPGLGQRSERGEKALAQRLCPPARQVPRYRCRWAGSQHPGRRRFSVNAQRCMAAT